MKQTLDDRVALAGEYLAGARRRKVTELPASVLMRELAETRRQFGQVLDVIREQATACATQAATQSGPTGPFETERQARETPAVQAVYRAFDAAPRQGGMNEPSHKLLCEALTAAGVELGAYDHRIVRWLAGWEPETCAVIAGLVTRAHAAGAATTVPAGVLKAVTGAGRCTMTRRRDTVVMPARPRFTWALCRVRLLGRRAWYSGTGKLAEWRFHALSAVLNRIAGRGLRHAALLMGFDMALGYGHEGMLLGPLDEYSIGNEIGWGVRYGTPSERSEALEWFALERHIFKLKAGLPLTDGAR
ncbi:MAG TPA: hypothetical protein VMV17_18765 [Streptosporangiaceae bacterium]|nr:hypothetical protein [Streptosporangiaceae bacterium]